MNETQGSLNELTINGLGETRATAFNDIALAFPKELSLEGWSIIGERILRVTNASSWWLGDWLVFGQENFPDRYRLAIDKTRLDYQTLRNYAWIARRFSPVRRRHALSFQHHVEVAALPEHEQDHWLELAENFGWSRNELRRQIRASTEVDESDDRKQEVQLRLSVTKERIDHWEKAASEAGFELVEWIAAALEEAARTHPHLMG